MISTMNFILASMAVKGDILLNHVFLLMEGCYVYYTLVNNFQKLGWKERTHNISTNVY